MKRRYLILNMALLSGTLLLCLAILFGILYHSEVSSSYTVMREMMNDRSIEVHEPPDHNKDETKKEPPEGRDKPDAVPQSDSGGAALQLLDYPYPGYWPWGWGWDWNQDDMPDDPAYWGYQFPDPFAGKDPRYEAPGQHDRDDRDNRDDRDDQDDRDDRDERPQPPATSGPQQSSGGSTTQTTARSTAPPPPESGRDPRQGSETQQGSDPGNPQQTEPNAGSQTAPPPGTGRTEPGSAHTTAATTTTTTVTTSTAAEKQSETTAAAQTTKLVPVEEGRYVPDAYIADFDKDGNLEAYAGNEKDSTEDESFRKVHHAMDEVKRKGAPSGTVKVGDESYRFLYEPDESGNYRLVLLDRTAEKSTISRMIFIFLLIAAVGLIIMFIISMLLANWTVTPVETAWEKQKQFVADASHELKTPLAVISANTEVILANPEESVGEQSKWLSYIQSETMRMSKLITGLLSAARMDHTKDAADKTELLPLSETVSNVCLVFEPIIYEKGKTLNTVIQRNVSLRADEDNIKQLLSILLDNAVLHSLPDAQITVSLSKDAQNKIRLSVANTAKDIPKDQLEHLFDRFYRVDTEGSPNGSGLGLSIAKSIVHQLGGTITVTSENQLVTFVALFHS